ncbi:glycosyltransferase family 4 protein [Thermodesulfatator atlanticus]|uniref:glycosyltransferase family 4 protein n=1 Tax=Thermodesulfatator atlanticus TaxID=501497 RepID=UPI0003B5C6F2|nr:glycosyltransferase family 4 protein [Thermodesulfatator atlanticus]
MNILLVTGKFPVPSQTFVYYDFLYAIKKGINASLLCKYKETHSYKIPKEYEQNIIQYSPKKVNLFSLQSLFFLQKNLYKFWPLVKNYGIELTAKKVLSLSYVSEKYRKFDLIHAHFIQWAFDIAFPLSKLLKIPFILSAHDGHILQYSSNIITCLHKNASAVIFPSNFQKMRWLSKSKIANEDNLFIIPNGIKLITNEKKSFNKFKEDMKKRVKILVVSRLIPQKRVSDAIKLAKLLLNLRKDVKLTIIGDGPEKNNLRQLAAKLSLTEKIDFRGFLPHDKVLEHMKNTHIFLHPSENESFGIVILEAMNAGAIVVAADSGPVKEFLPNNAGYIYSPGDLNSLFAIIKSILDDPQKAFEKSLNAIEISSNYSLEKHFSLILDLWDKVIS